jgi:hypothetical protein
MPFPSTLKKFSENGFFELKNSEFSSANIQDLEKISNNSNRNNLVFLCAFA